MPDQQQQINYGAAPNDGQGDPLRDAFIKTDDNFDAVWAAGPVGSNVTILNNTVAVVNTNGNLVLRPNGVGVIQANASIVPDSANIRDLGSADRRWRRVYLQTLNTIDYEVDGNLTVSGNLTIQGDTIQIGNLITDALTLQLANTVVDAQSADGAGITVGASDDIATLLYDGANNTWDTNIGLGVSGNVTADYFIGDGSQLTGLPEQYNDSNVVTLLAALGSNSISTTGNVTAGYYVGNGSQLTGMYSNTDVAAYLPDYTGNLAGGNLTIQNGVGNTWTISGQRILAPSGGEWRSKNDTLDDFITSAPDGYINLQSLYDNGAIASELKLEHGVARIVVANAPFREWTFRNTGQLEVPGNIVPTANGVYNLGDENNQWGELWVANNTIYLGGVALGVTGNVLTVAGEPVLSNDSDATITTTGNITANYFIGNGSQLTGLPAGYSDSNVSTFLAAFGSNSISTTGNITATRLQNDANLVIRSNVAGTLRTWTFDTLGDLNLPVGGNITTTGNVYAGNLDITGNIIHDGNIQGSITGVVTMSKFIAFNNTLYRSEYSPGSISLYYDNNNNIMSLDAPGNVGGNTGTVYLQNVDQSGNTRSTISISADSFSFASGACTTPVYDLTSSFEVTSTGNVTAGNITLTGNVVAGSAANITFEAGAYTMTFDTTGNLSTSGANGNITGAYVVSAAVVRTLPTTVSLLPAANAVGAGSRAFVTDANTATFGTTITGGAANAVPVYSDGSAWRVG